MVQYCFTSTETIWLVRTESPIWFSVALRPQRRDGLLGTGTEWEGGESVKGSTAETARKRPERPRTAARTMEVLRRCPLAIAQRLVHRAIAISTAVLDRVTKTMSVAPLLTNNSDNSKQKTSNLLSPAPPPYSWSLLGKCEGAAPPPSSKIFWSRLEPCVKQESPGRPPRLSHWTLKGRGGPSAQVFTLQIVRAIKLPPNQKKRKDDRKEKVKGSWPSTHNALGYIYIYIWWLR